jgi:hypothetical protein
MVADEVIYAQENKDMYFSLGAVQTKFGSTDVSSETNNGITLSTVSEAYKKNNYKVTFGKRLKCRRFNFHIPSTNT